MELVILNNSGDIIVKEKCQNSINEDNSQAGTVLLGDEEQPSVYLGIDP